MEKKNRFLYAGSYCNIKYKHWNTYQLCASKYGLQKRLELFFFYSTWSALTPNHANISFRRGLPARNIIKGIYNYIFVKVGNDWHIRISHKYIAEIQQFYYDYEKLTACTDRALHDRDRVITVPCIKTFYISCRVRAAPRLFALIRNLLYFTVINCGKAL